LEQQLATAIEQEDFELADRLDSQSKEANERLEKLLEEITRDGSPPPEMSPVADNNNSNNNDDDHNDDHIKDAASEVTNAENTDLEITSTST